MKWVCNNNGSGNYSFHTNGRSQILNMCINEWKLLPVVVQRRGAALLLQYNYGIHRTERTKTAALWLSCDLNYNFHFSLCDCTSVVIVWRSHSRRHHRHHHHRIASIVRFLWIVNNNNAYIDRLRTLGTDYLIRLAGNYRFIVAQSDLSFVVHTWHA